MDRLKNLLVNRVALVPRGDNPEAHLLLWKSAPTSTTATALTPGEAFALRAFTAEQREQMAANGQAMKDGSFPIANASDLKNAISTYGRASDKAAAKAHIIRRARALGKTALLPEGWNVTNKDARLTRGRMQRLRDAFGLLGGVLDEAGDRKEDEVGTEKIELPADLPEEVRDYIGKVEAERDEAVKKAETPTPPAPTPPPSPTPTPTPEPKPGEALAKALEAADPAVREAIEKAQADATAAQERATVLEEAVEKARVEKADADWTTKAGSLRHLPVKPEDLGPMLRKVAEANPEAITEVERVLNAAEAVASEAFLTIGKDGDGPSAGAINDLVGDVRKADPTKTREQALVEVMGTPEGRKAYADAERERKEG